MGYFETSQYLGYLAPKLREQYIRVLTENVLKNLSDRDLLIYCPQYLGTDVGPAHRDYVRQKAIKELGALDDYTLIRRYVDAVEKDGIVADSFKMGHYVGDKEKLN